MLSLFQILTPIVDSIALRFLLQLFSQHSSARSDLLPFVTAAATACPQRKMVALSFAHYGDDAWSSAFAPVRRSAKFSVVIRAMYAGIAQLFALVLVYNSSAAAGLNLLAAFLAPVTSLRMFCLPALSQRAFVSCDWA